MKRINIFKIATAAFVISTLLFLASALFNKGFYYSDLKQQIVVNFADNNKENFERVLELENISRIDRDDLIIYFENTSETNVATDLNEEFKEEEITYTVKKVLPGDSMKIVENIAYFSLTNILSFSLIYFYIKFRKTETKSGLKPFLKDVTLLSFISLFTVLYQFGLLSLISRFYQVRIYDIYIPLIAVFVVQFLFYKYLFSTDFTSLIESLKNNFNKDAKNILKISPLILIPISFGLGQNFVVPAIILLIGLISFTILTNLYLNFSSIKKFFQGKSKTLKSSTPNSNKEVQKSKSKSKPSKRKTAKFRKKK